MTLRITVYRELKTFYIYVISLIELRSYDTIYMNKVKGGQVSKDPLKRLIQQYLIKVKEIVIKNGIEFIERDKNLNFMTNLGLTINDVKECILSLTPSNYLSGPSKDHDSRRREDVFEYLITYKDKELYLKIKIVQLDNKEIVRCISFHEREY